MIQKQILALCLYNEFWKDAKRILNIKMFPKEFNSIYTAILYAHKRYETDLSVMELLLVHRDKFPALPQATRDNVEDVIKDLGNVKIPHIKLAKDVLYNFWKRDKARELGEKAIDIYKGKDNITFGELQKIIDDATDKEKIEGGATYSVVNEDIEELLKEAMTDLEFKFNLEPLSLNIEGLSRGHFGIILARPELGKTTFACHLAQEYIRQKKKVVYWANEEPAVRIKLRILQSYFEREKHEMMEDMGALKKVYHEVIKPYLIVHDCVGTDISEITEYAELNKPDVIFIDQLDKIKISGSYDRGDEKLKALYVQSREICKKANCLVWAVSQASYNGENRQLITYAMLDNSRTGKAGEADFIIGIGKPSEVDTDGTRILNISKNKVNGWHGYVTCRMDYMIGRFYP